MTELIIGGMKADPGVKNPASVRQLRREAAKARSLADNAFTEAERQSLQEVAASLDREATAIEIALRMKEAGAPISFRRRPVRSGLP